MRAAFLALAAVIAACHPSPAPSTPTTDASDSGIDRAPDACRNWARWCQWGADAQCADAFRNAASTGSITQGDLACVATAGSLAAATACKPDYFVCGPQ